MCIIIYDKRRESSQRVGFDVLKRAQEKYPHGLGMMWAENGVLHTWHSMTDLEGMWNRYTTLRDAKLPVALHFRFTTQGDNTLENCHPFIIEPGKRAFMHNGTIYGVKSLVPAQHSDSRFMRDEILRYLPSDFLSKPGLTTLLDKFIVNDRMLFMDNHGMVTIFNSATGFWLGDKDAEGVWFSHTRDKEFLLTGRTYAAATQKDPHAAHRNAANDWYRGDRRSSTQVASGADRTASPVAKQSTYPDYISELEAAEEAAGRKLSKKERKQLKKARERREFAQRSMAEAIVKRDEGRKDSKPRPTDNLIFCYGNLYPNGEHHLGVKHITKGRLVDAQLWACSAMGTDEEIPGSVHRLGMSVQGNLYAIGGDEARIKHYLDIMDVYAMYDEDHPTLGMYQRVFREIEVPSADGGRFVSVWAWTYLLNEESNTLIDPLAPITHGDWAKWYGNTAALRQAKADRQAFKHATADEPKPTEPTKPVGPAKPVERTNPGTPAMRPLPQLMQPASQPAQHRKPETKITAGKLRITEGDGYGVVSCPTCETKQTQVIGAFKPNYMQQLYCFDCCVLFEYNDQGAEA